MAMRDRAARGMTMNMAAPELRMGELEVQKSITAENFKVLGRPVETHPSFTAAQ